MTDVIKLLIWNPRFLKVYLYKLDLKKIGDFLSLCTEGCVQTEKASHKGAPLLKKLT